MTAPPFSAKREKKTAGGEDATSARADRAIKELVAWDRANPEPGREWFNDTNRKRWQTKRDALIDSFTERYKLQGDDLGEASLRAAKASKSESFKETLFSAMRPARGSDQARAAAKTFVNVPLRNADSGIIATVSGESLGKMLSKSSWSRSLSPQAHMQAVANLDKLFPAALIHESRRDRDSTPEIAAIHHFEVPMPFDQDVLRVKIMAKELNLKDQGTRLYLVQAVEIKKPASIGGTPDEPTSIPPAGFEEKFNRLAAQVKIEKPNPDGVAPFSASNRDRLGNGDETPLVPRQPSMVG